MADTATVQDVHIASAPPYAPRRDSPTAMAGAYLRLVRVQLAEYRSTWPVHLFFGLLMPLGMIFFWMNAGAELTRERAIFILGGNLVASIAYGPATLLIGRLGWGRQNRMLEFWAGLPVAKTALLLAIVTVALLLALPGILTVYLLGCLMLGLPLTSGLALLPLVLLGALSVTGLAAFLGVRAKDGPTANALSNLFVGCSTFLSPLYLPLEVMPLPMRLVAHAMPTTYAAGAFRSALAGKFGPDLAYHVLMLVLFSVVLLWLVHRKLDWRSA